MKRSYLNHSKVSNSLISSPNSLDFPSMLSKKRRRIDNQPPKEIFKISKHKLIKTTVKLDRTNDGSTEDYSPNNFLCSNLILNKNSSTST